MARVKRNDTVVVIAGDDKGKSGRVLHVDRAKNRVLIEGINVRKKAVRRTPEAPQGGINDIECPVHISNVMLEDVYKAKHPGGSTAEEAVEDSSVETPAEDDSSDAAAES